MLATVLYLALIICVWGFISLLTNTNVISERVGPLLGPVIVATAAVIVFAGCLARIRNHNGWLLPVVVAASVYLAPAIIGAFVVVVSQADLAAGILFFAARATSPYVPAAAIIGAALILLVPFVRGRAVSAD